MRKNNNKVPKVLQPAKRSAVVLVHGFRGAPVGLTRIAQILQQNGYQVYVPAIPPFAGASRLAGYTPQTYADFLVQYIKDQKLSLPVLVGHSMGSLVVASALQTYPKLFNQQAILMSPISKRTALPFRFISPLSGLAPRKVVDYITTKFLFIPRKDKNLFKETLTLTHFCSNDHPPSIYDIFGAAKFSTSFAITDFELSQNILLLAGAKDRLIPQKQTLTAANQLHAKVRFLDDAGHLHNYERPIETARAII